MASAECHRLYADYGQRQALTIKYLRISLILRLKVKPFDLLKQVILGRDLSIGAIPSTTGIVVAYLGVYFKPPREFCIWRLKIRILGLPH